MRSFNDDDNCQMIKNKLSQIINSQDNLRKILLEYNMFPLYHLLLSLKNSNYSNTLNTIIFYYINFENIIVLNEVFNQLNALESIHIIFCRSLDKFIQQIINITKPFKLKSLFLNRILQIESGKNIEDFGIRGINKPQQLLQLLDESVIIYCKIKFLDIHDLNNQNIVLVFNLIENINQNLNYLLIDIYDNSHLSSIILQNLGQILPFKLEYLNLSLAINISDLETFLKNLQNTFIEKLVINNEVKDGSKSIFPYIEKYFIKKKGIKYLAITEYIPNSIMNFYDLFFLKDKVNQLKLYDIQVLDYDSLNIGKIGKFIYENKYFY